MSALTASAAGSCGSAVPRVVVTVGTDHHQFDRLIGWINDWLSQNPGQAGAVFVQSGAASISPACESEGFMDAAQLGALLDSADVVICHGGPGSIADAWARGHLPIVVPRLRQYSEVVDDHQVDFCIKLAELGRVRLAQTPAALAELLDEAAHGGLRLRADEVEADVEAAVARFGTLVDELVSRPRRRLQLFHRAGRGLSANARTRTTVSSLASTPIRDGLAGVPKEELE